MKKIKLYKMKDALNGDKWTFDSVKELKDFASNYLDLCEGDCVLVYKVFDF